MAFLASTVVSRRRKAASVPVLSFITCSTVFSFGGVLNDMGGMVWEGETLLEEATLENVGGSGDVRAVLFPLYLETSSKCVHSWSPMWYNLNLTLPSIRKWLRSIVGTCGLRFGDGRLRWLECLIRTWWQLLSGVRRKWAWVNRGKQWMLGFDIVADLQNMEYWMTDHIEVIV